MTANLLIQPLRSWGGRPKRKRLERAGQMLLGMEFKSDRVTACVRHFLNARRWIF